MNVCVPKDMYVYEMWNDQELVCIYEDVCAHVCKQCVNMCLSMWYTIYGEAKDLCACVCVCT